MSVRDIARIAVFAALTAAMGLLILGVAIGLPLLAGGRGGIGVFVSPIVGYLIGYVIAPIVIGLIVGRRPTWLRVGLGCLIGGIFSIYLFGIPIQAWLTELSIGESLITSLAFLPGDLTKMVIATLITTALYRASPRSFEQEGSQREVAVSH